MKRITLLVVTFLSIGSITARANQFNFSLSLVINGRAGDNNPIVGESYASGTFYYDDPAVAIDISPQPLADPTYGQFNAGTWGGTVTSSVVSSVSGCNGYNSTCTQTDVSFSGANFVIGGSFSGGPLANVSGVIMSGAATGAGTVFDMYDNIGDADLTYNMSGNITITYISPQFLAALGFQGTPELWGGSGGISGSGIETAQGPMDSETGSLGVDVSGWANADPAPEPGTVVLLGTGLFTLGVCLLRLRRSRATPSA